MTPPTAFRPLAHSTKAAKKNAGSTGNLVEKRVSAPPPDLPEIAAKPSGIAQEKTVTVKEAAFRLGKSPDDIYLWLRRGRLRGWQPGGHCCAILVLESSVEQALLNSLGTF